jgi:hypothetical protein
MFKEHFDYVDYFGNERSEDLYFDLSEPEVLRLNFSSVGGLKETVERITQEQNGKRIIALFESIIQAAYGERSEDGRTFIKNEAAKERFIYSKPYSMMYMKLATDDKYAAKFLDGIIPKSIKDGNATTVVKQ